MNLFTNNSKIFEIKKSFAKILYDRRIKYGNLCKMNIANNNLRLNKNLTIEGYKEKNQQKLQNKIEGESKDINLFLNESSNNTECEEKNNKENIQISDLKINLMGDFREEIEKVFYDSKLILDPTPLKREIRLKKMLTEKIKRLNYLTNNH